MYEREHGSFVMVPLKALTQARLNSVKKNGTMSFNYGDLIDGDRPTLLHPHTYKLIKQALSKKKGVKSIPITIEEIIANMNKDMLNGGALEGGSFRAGSIDGGSIFTKLYRWVKDKAIPWIQKHKKYISPIFDTVGHLTDVYTGTPAGTSGRNLVKGLTGIGVSGKSEDTSSGMTDRRRKQLENLKKAREARMNKQYNKMSSERGGSFKKQ